MYQCSDRQISDLRLKQLLLLASVPGNHKRWYSYYYYLSEFTGWTMGMAYLTKRGEQKLAELLNTDV